MYSIKLKILKHVLILKHKTHLPKLSNQPFLLLKISIRNNKTYLVTIVMGRG